MQVLGIVYCGGMFAEHLGKDRPVVALHVASVRGGIIMYSVRTAGLF